MAPQLNERVWMASFHIISFWWCSSCSFLCDPPRPTLKTCAKLAWTKPQLSSRLKNSVFRTVKNTRQEPALVAEAVPTLITWRDGCLLWHVTHLLIYLMDKGRSPWHFRDHFCYLSKIYKFNTSCVHTLLTVCCWKVRMVFGSALHYAQIWRVQTYWIYERQVCAKWL